MKKYLYSLMGCAALLTVGTVQGREAIAQAFDAVVSATAPAKAEGEHNSDAYIKVASPTGVYGKFNPETGFVDLSFTAPNTAAWSDDYWSTIDKTELKPTIDYIKIYRVEGAVWSFSTETATLVKSFPDVAWLADIEYTDESPLDHGKTYTYFFVGEYNGHLGENSYKQVEVGYVIDPAEDYVVTPGAEGALEVTVSFTAPTTTNDKSYTLPADTQIEKIEITRQQYSTSWYDTYDEEVIKTFENVTPGEALSYTDKDEALLAKTKYNYRLVIYFDGKSTKSYFNNETVYVGPDTPQAPTDLTAVLQEDGTVKITWTAPTKGNNDGWFDPTAVRFKVERSNGTGYYAQLVELASGLEATEFVDDNIIEEGKYYYRVTSQMDGVDYKYTETQGEDAIVAGPPSPFPFAESWSNRNADHSTWSYEGDWTVTGNTYMSFYDDNDNYVSLDVYPADGDEGLIYTYVRYQDAAGDVLSLTSGRIAMADAINPIVTFKYFDFAESLSDNELGILVSADGGEFVPLENLSFSSFDHNNKWVSVVASLADYVEACEYIQVRIAITLGEKRCKTVVDAFEVRDAKFADLAVEGVTAPAKFYPGASMNVTVTVSNSGDFAAEPFAAMVYINGQELGYGECEGLSANSETMMSVPVVIPENVNEGKAEITVSIEGMWEPDMENNSGSCEAEVIALPAASNLAYNADERMLTWDAAEELPFFDGSTNVVEDFSGYDHMTTGAFGGWTVIDGDGDSTYCLPGYENYPGERGATGGFVFQPSVCDITEGSKNIWDTPVAGGKCFVFPGCYDYADDWLISPELTGAAQTLTYKLAAADTFGSCSEKYEVCVSFTDALPGSFEVLKEVVVNKTFETDPETGNYIIPWDDYSYDLPAGTKYFAIHYTKGYGGMIALTDICFATGSGMTSEPTVLEGYNVYCDGVKVTEQPVTETQYEVPADKAGDYFVKAAYNNAESAPTSVVTVNTTGVDAVSAATGKLLAVEGTTLVISGTGAYTVADVAGRTVAAGDGAARVAVVAGTYVVVVDGEVFKVAVK